MRTDEGRAAFNPLPALMAEFWTVGGENRKLVQAGQKEQAFAFLLDKTIPARTRLLAPLDAEKVRRVNWCRRRWRRLALRRNSLAISASAW